MPFDTVCVVSGETKRAFAARDCNIRDHVVADLQTVFLSLRRIEVKELADKLVTDDRFRRGVEPSGMDVDVRAAYAACQKCGRAVSCRSLFDRIFCNGKGLICAVENRAFCRFFHRLCLSYGKL